MANPIWCGSTPDRGWKVLIKFWPQTLSSVLTIGLENTWRLTGTSGRWLSTLVILSAVGYMTLDLDQSWQCHCISTWVPSLWSESSHFHVQISIMLSQNVVSVNFETEHICPSLLCCEIQDVMVFLLELYLQPILWIRQAFNWWLIKLLQFFCGLGQASSPCVQILVTPSAEFNKNCLSFSSLIFLCPLLLSPSYSVLEDCSPLSKRTLQRNGTMFLLLPRCSSLPGIQWLQCPSARDSLLAVFSKLAFSLSAIKLLVLYISFSLLWDYFCRAERVGYKECLHP